MTLRAALPLLALSFTLTLSAQPAPQAQAAAAIARSLLQSKTLPDEAWGAYLAAEIPDESLNQTLVSELRAATDHDYRAALFDALIRSQAHVPTDLLLTFDPEWRDEVLILLARNPAVEIEPPLLTLLDGDQLTPPQWTLVSNLLFRIAPKVLIRRTLQRLTALHTFVLDSHNLWLAGDVSDCFVDGGLEHNPNGLPPFRYYQLRVTAAPGAVVVSEGPRPVYYWAGPRVPNLNWRRVCREDHEESRLGYLAAFSQRAVDGIRGIFLPNDDLVWKGPEAFRSQAATILDAQADAILMFLRDLRALGVDVSGLAFRIEPKITDAVSSPHDPIPAIPVREVTFQD